jgi:hypothetical protein
MSSFNLVLQTSTADLPGSPVSVSLITSGGEVTVLSMTEAIFDGWQLQPGTPNLALVSVTPASLTLSWMGLQTGYNFLSHAVQGQTCAGPASFVDDAAAAAPALAPTDTPVSGFSLSGAKTVTTVVGSPDREVSPWMVSDATVTGPAPASLACILDATLFGEGQRVVVTVLDASGAIAQTFTLASALLDSLTLQAGPGPLTQTTSMNFLQLTIGP